MSSRSIAISNNLDLDLDSNRSTPLRLLAPSSHLGLLSRSFGGVPEGSQIFDR